MRRHVSTAIRMTILTAVLLGLLYPLAITGIAQVAFPGAAGGSLAKVDGRVVGSTPRRRMSTHSIGPGAAAPSARSTVQIGFGAGG